jgi:hypothetical protein
MKCIDAEIRAAWTVPPGTSPGNYGWGQKSKDAFRCTEIKFRCTSGPSKESRTFHSNWGIALMLMSNQLGFCVSSKLAFGASSTKNSAWEQRKLWLS